MTGTEVAVREHGTILTNEQLNYISRTEFVPPGLRGNLPAILACVATGRALGLPDMTALRSIHIIDGKATFSAELMVQLVRQRGHSIVGEVDEGEATVTGTRLDNGDTMTATWTLAMAERAGLLGKSNWKKYPEAMLWARAASQLCRMLFADCFAGATYTPEELDGEPFVEVGGESGEPVAAAPVEVPADAEPLPADTPTAPTDQLTEAQHKMIERLLNVLALDRDAFKEQIGVAHMTDISKHHASQLIEQLKEQERIADEALPEVLKP